MITLKVFKSFDSLDDLGFTGQARDVVDFIVANGFGSELFSYLDTYCKDFTRYTVCFTLPELENYITSHMFEICDAIGFDTDIPEFSGFLKERGYR